MIKRSDYDTLLEQIESTGNVYNTNISIQYIDENPSKKTTADKTDEVKIGENIYYIEYTAQIEDEFEKTEDGIIKLHSGDYVKIDVENINTTIYQMIQNSLYSISGGTIGTISGEHTALIIQTTDGNMVSSVQTGLQYTVKYNANGGIQNTCPYPERNYTQTKNSGEDLILSSVEPRHSNALYKFSGWAESPDATTAKYSSGGTFRKNQNVTLYAVWTKVTYSVTYLSNVNKNITGLPAEDRGIEPGTNYRIWNKAVPKGEGYTFLCWNTSADGSGVRYNPGDAITVNDNLVFYAIWNVQEYKLTYNKNTNDNVTDMPVDEIHQYNTTFFLSTKVPKRTGYKFVGWSTTPNGAVTNPNGSLYTMSAQNVTLYAVWNTN